MIFIPRRIFNHRFVWEKKDMSNRRPPNKQYNRNRRNKRNSRRKNKSSRQSDSTVITVRNENNHYKKQQYIQSLLFDIMFDLNQNKIKKLDLRSQGHAISVCADLVLALEKRCESQFIPIKKQIRVKSRFFKNKRKGSYKRKSNRKNDGLPDPPNMISYFDVRIYFNE